MKPQPRYSFEDRLAQRSRGADVGGRQEKMPYLGC